MREIDADNAAAYLVEAGQLPAGMAVDIRELGGGVSNQVLLVQPAGRSPWVIKQARERLRVPQPWFCSVERIRREIDVLRRCQQLLGRQPVAPTTHPAPAIQTPELIFEDRDNYLFGMTAAPMPHSTWKERLMCGEPNTAIAAACGGLLGRLHAGTWQDADVARELDDRQFFAELRIDPYFREVARVHEDLRPAIERLIESVWHHRRCLVHGDFSPKNLLVWDGGLMLIDFEVGHFGDPAFDLGFFLTHLVLKSFRAGRDAGRYLSLIDSFWAAYVQSLASSTASGELPDLEARTAQNLAGCLLARVDGKSRVDYPTDVDSVRRLARRLLGSPPAPWNVTMTTIREFVPGRLVPGGMRV